jgi:hypothetical protein
MENKKVSKKTLNSLLNDSMREVISNLELPKPTKKVQKVLDRSSKKLAAVFADILKKKNKKAKKERKNLFFVEDVLNQKKGKKSKHLKKQQSPVIAE